MKAAPRNDEGTILDLVGWHEAAADRAGAARRRANGLRFDREHVCERRVEVAFCARSIVNGSVSWSVTDPCFDAYQVVWRVHRFLAQISAGKQLRRHDRKRCLKNDA